MNTLLLLLIMLVPGGSHPMATAQDQDATVIAAYIARQARQEHGEEYQDARKVVAGDLNHDDVPETVVLYTIEGQGGSNNYVQYVAVFTHREGRLVPLTYTAVGGKSRRSVELKTVEGNTIHLGTLNYGPKDASCCPSIKGTTTYLLAGRRLSEQRSRTRGRAA